MTTSPSTNRAPIESKDQLVRYFEAGEKPAAEWRLGTEHEKFVYTRADLKPLPYNGDVGICSFLNGLKRFGWEPILEGETMIGLKQAGEGSITLEPGGQLELSGAPLDSVHETCAEVNTHLRQVREVADEVGVGLIGLGFTPTWTRDEMPWMPKGRYKIMRDYMPKVGTMGLDMMLRTCTVQVNMDYADEADMVLKFRVAMALQPLATALWANSPFTEGKPNGLLSRRAAVWHNTDPDRTGILPFIFEDGFGYERYVDYVLDVPMYFVYRDGYVDAAGQSFRDFLNGTLPALPGEKPTMADFEDHLSTIFPEVRLKQFLEMRGTDSGPWRRLCALPAFWAGLLYDRAALEEAWDVVKVWDAADRQALYDAVGFVRLLGLPHIVVWTPLAAYLVWRLRQRDLPAAPRIVTVVFTASICLSLAFDYVDVARWLMGERGPMVAPPG